MTTEEIIELQLEAFFGSQLSRKIQDLVNRELDAGVWVNGYDLAVSDSEIPHSDATELLEIVLRENEGVRIDREDLQEAVDATLPMSSFTNVQWIVDESGDYALTDSLRVARFCLDKPVWRTPRLSFDGIEFDSIQDGKLNGRAWLLGSHESPYAPFELDFSSGDVLSGHVVEK
jgi:hypothetical protein